MTNLEKYQQMLKKLAEIRKKHNQQESDEEDALLDEMDVIWYKLTEDEKQQTRGTRD